MPDQELIDGLIATYRELNINVRPLPEERLQRKGSDGASVRDIVTHLRDDELRFSQALKERITGVPMPDIFGAASDKPIVGSEDANDSTREILAQFGTARESTLAMLRSLPDPEWDQTVDGGKSIRARIGELVQNDRRQLARISSLIGRS